MRKLMDSVLHRYGSTAQLQTAAGTQTVKVFFRNVNSDAWQNVERMFSALGEVPRGRYICLMPAGVQAAAENTLSLLGKSYQLRRVEQIIVADQLVGQWCLCVERGGEDG